MEQDLNRLKVVLVERKRTSKWLAEELGKTMSILKTLLPATKAKFYCSNITYFAF